MKSAGDGAAVAVPPVRRRRSRPVDGSAPPPAPGAPASAAARAAGPARATRRVGGRAAGPVHGLAAALVQLGATRTQVALALLCWAGLAGVVYGADPDEVWARLTFFGGLFGALFFTLAPVLRAISLRFSHSRLYQQAAGRHATRQALMLAAFVVLNAALQMVRAWSGLTALLLLGMFAVIEVVALARR